MCIYTHLEDHAALVFAQNKQTHTIDFEGDFNRHHHPAHDFVRRQLRRKGGAELVKDAFDLRRRVHVVDVQDVLHVLEQRARFVVLRPVHVNVCILSNKSIAPTDELFVDTAAEDQASGIADRADRGSALFRCHERSFAKMAAFCQTIHNATKISAFNKARLILDQHVHGTVVNDIKHVPVLSLLEDDVAATEVRNCCLLLKDAQLLVAEVGKRWDAGEEVLRAHLRSSNGLVPNGSGAAMIATTGIQWILKHQLVAVRLNVQCESSLLREQGQKARLEDFLAKWVGFMNAHLFVCAMHCSIGCQTSIPMENFSILINNLMIDEILGVWRSGGLAV